MVCFKLVLTHLQLDQSWQKRRRHRGEKEPKDERCPQNERHEKIGMMTSCFFFKVKSRKWMGYGQGSEFGAEFEKEEELGERKKKRMTRWDKSKKTTQILLFEKKFWLSLFSF